MIFALRIVLVQVSAIFYFWDGGEDIVAGAGKGVYGAARPFPVTGPVRLGAF